jgi:prepilin-type N-terminal cleavage/methylation domain-containing protein
MKSINKRKFSKNTHGFTFIEILTVIIVIGILVGASIPAYLWTREDAIERKKATAIQRVAEAKTKFYNAEKTAAALVSTPSLTDVAKYLQLDPTETKGPSGTATTNAFFSDHPHTIFADCFPKNERWFLNPGSRTNQPVFQKLSP